MERIIPRYDKSLPPARLYKEDIESIVALFQEIHPKCLLSADDYTFSPLELDEYAKTHSIITSLWLHGLREGDAAGQRLEVHLGSYIGITVNDGKDKEAIGIATKIEDIIRRKRAMFSGFLHSQWLNAAVWLGFIPLLIALSIAHMYTALILAIFLYPAAYVTLANCLGGRYCAIYLVHSHDKSSFVRRQKDAIRLIILSAIITNPISACFGYYIGKWTANPLDQKAVIQSPQPTTPTQPSLPKP